MHNTSATPPNTTRASITRRWRAMPSASACSAVVMVPTAMAGSTAWIADRKSTASDAGQNAGGADADVPARP